MRRVKSVCPSLFIIDGGIPRHEKAGHAGQKKDRAFVETISTHLAWKFPTSRVKISSKTTDTFVLREKLRGSRINPACVSHEKQYFPLIYLRHTCKGKSEPSCKLFCIPQCGGRDYKWLVSNIPRWGGGGVTNGWCAIFHGGRCGYKWLVCNISQWGGGGYNSWCTILGFLIRTCPCWQSQLITVGPGHVKTCLMMLSFQTDRSGQTLQTQIRLQFRLDFLDALLYDKSIFQLSG